MPGPTPTHSGVVPYLERGGAIHTVIITSNRGKWCFPKGYIDPGDSAHQAAEIEAREEAGLLGEIHHEPFTRYTRAKMGKIILVEMYLFRVTRVLETWDEADWRKRKIVALNAARPQLRKDLRRVLDQAARNLMVEGGRMTGGA